MCGIAGQWGAYPPELIGQMGASIAHRGPDDAGEWVSASGAIALAHRRLAILDLSRTGHQPMESEDGGVVLTYNGEIYNFRELAAELCGRGVAFKGNSDSEVLLRAYVKYGLGVLSRLNGIFAFGIWDPRTNELIVARDPLGVKPLYYAETRSGFLFASEMKAILQSEEVSRDLDLVALDHHLHYLWAPSPGTMLSGVRKLEPGCYLVVRDARIVRKACYYSLADRCQRVAMRSEDAVEQAREIVERAVARQLVSDVEVGAFLSGGVDSSTVVAAAVRARGGASMPCFTIGFRDQDALGAGMGEDLPYAQAVARHIGVDLRTVFVGPDMVDHLSEMLYFLDEPQADPAPISALFISRLARESGIKVLLSGAGGDDIFSGYRRHTAVHWEPAWTWLPRGMRRAARTALGLLPIQHKPVEVTMVRRIAKLLGGIGLDSEARLANYFFWSDPSVVRALYSRNVRLQLAGIDPAAPLLDVLRRVPRGVGNFQRMLHLETRFFLGDHNLNYTDKMGMAAGVEVRVPLLDLELVEFAFSVPVRYKRRKGVNKWILREAARPWLPKSVLTRRKVGFGAPLRAWLRGPLREQLHDALSERAVRTRGVFDSERIQDLLSQNERGAIDASYLLFALLCIELWCRMFVDPPRPQLA